MGGIYRSCSSSPLAKTWFGGSLRVPARKACLRACNRSAQIVDDGTKDDEASFRPKAAGISERSNIHGAGVCPGNHGVSESSDNHGASERSNNHGASDRSDNHGASDRLDNHGTDNHGASDNRDNHGASDRLDN